MHNKNIIMQLSIMGLLLSSYTFANAATLQVGNTQTYKTPCAAFSAASDGDTVEIDAKGNYTGNVCYFAKNNLTIKGVNGRAKIDANGNQAAGKGTWVIGGANNVVENIEFSGAKVPDRNGAGIRLDGKSLTVRNSYFHNNENGILTSNNGGDIIIENTEFGFNGFGDGYSHNVYVGRVDSLTFIGNYSHDALGGHNLKTRAAKNIINYNRFSSTTGNPSYEVDVPNAGTTYVVGNIIQQPARPSNPGILTYGVEGATNPGKDLYVVNNTFINDSSSSARFIYVGDQVTQPVLVQNNLFVGVGTQVTQGIATTVTNYATLTSPFVNKENFDLRPLPNNASIVNAGTNVTDKNQLASRHYMHPAQTAVRAKDTKIDIGAYETQGNTTLPVRAIKELIVVNIADLPNLIYRSSTPSIPKSPINGPKPVPVEPTVQEILKSPFGTVVK
jgi:hypothetical protein